MRETEHLHLHKRPTALAEHGVCLAQSSLSRFFKRYDIS